MKNGNLPSDGTPEKHNVYRVFSQAIRINDASPIVSWCLAKRGPIPIGITSVQTAHASAVSRPLSQLIQPTYLVSFGWPAVQHAKPPSPVPLVIWYLKRASA